MKGSCLKMLQILLGLFILVAAHCFGDYVFQNDFIAKKKYSSFLILFVHCILYTSACLIGVFVVDLLVNMRLGDFQYFLIMITMISSHYCVDVIKINTENRLKTESEETKTKYLWIDQMAHLAVILMIYFILVVKSPWQ